MKLVKPTLTEIKDWLLLAGEVEPLFGPMVDDPNFSDALRQAFDKGTALSAKSPEPENALAGGVVVDPSENEIAWLAVSKARQRQGVGDLLLKGGLDLLSRTRPVKVVTFAPGPGQAEAALGLYRKHGFIFHSHSGLNPAGLAVQTLVKPVAQAQRP